MKFRNIIKAEKMLKQWIKKTKGRERGKDIGENQTNERKIMKEKQNETFWIKKVKIKRKKQRQKRSIKKKRVTLS